MVEVYIWGGIIKHIFLFLLIFLFSFSVFFIYSVDLTDDIKKPTESEYFEKVKKTMSGNGNQDTKVTEKRNQENKKKTKITIGYFSYIKIIIVLALVILTIYGMSLVLKRILRIKGKIAEGSDVIINQSLGQGKWIQVVYIAGKYLVLGVTNDRINLLTEIKEKKEIERFEIILNEKRTEQGGNFIEVVSDFIKKKLKKKINKDKFDYEVDSMDFLKNQRERIDRMNE